MTDIDERLDAVIIKQVFSKDIVYGLRMQQTSRIANEAANEIERLRKDKAELLKALTDLYEACRWEKVAPEIDTAKAAIAKAKGGE